MVPPIYFNFTPFGVLDYPASVGRRMTKMYVYYEEFKDANGTLLLTEVVLSSYAREAKIDWSSKSEKAQFDILNAYFKSIPGDKRAYDATSHVWTYKETTGAALISTIQSGITGGLLGNCSVNKIIDLEDKVAKKELNRKDPKPRKPEQVEIKFKEEEFFYAPEPKAELSGEKLWSALATQLEIPVELVKTGTKDTLKGAYRRAALRFHPDRNDGDGSKMSELNYLWGLFNS